MAWAAHLPDARKSGPQLGQMAKTARNKVATFLRSESGKMTDRPYACYSLISFDHDAHSFMETEILRFP